MIIVALRGGLGNQMFQYATGRAVSLRSWQNLALDLSWYSLEHHGHQRRRYLLDKFSVQASVATDDDLAVFRPTDVKNPEGEYRTIREESFAFQGRYQSDSVRTYLDGYWQSEKYFLDFAEQIRRELAPGEDVLGACQQTLDRIRSSLSVAIHVRRSDFANDPKTHAFHGVCTVDYYRSAVKFMEEWLVTPTFYVFSDDPTWCKSNLSFESATEYLGNSNEDDPTVDFSLMTNCKHFINANSSFSWWAAWLATNPNKIVIAPRKLVAGEGLDVKDYFPPGWIRL
jgi:hypothetical protein